MRVLKLAVDSEFVLVDLLAEMKVELKVSKKVVELDFLMAANSVDLKVSLKVVL